MASKKKRISVDMDDTIVDTLSKVISMYNQEFSGQLCKEGIREIGKKVLELMPAHQRERIFSFHKEPDFFASLEPKPDAIEVLHEMSAVYDIFIVTAAMEFPNSFTAKYQWLEKHLPFISPLNFVFCGHKNIINSDFLIDDTPSHFKGFCGQGILFDSPMNCKQEGYVRVKNWLEVKKMFLKD